MMRDAIVASILLLAVIASAVAVVHTHHVRRSLFVELDEVDARRDRLQVEWGRLQIEQSTWAASDRIERVAAQKLNLQLSRAGATVLVAAERGD
ncbi:MAG: cell division protein FtsL [Gammaproteobacteria bacterium]|nr:cell division protein FtsL [Gammaproteobacteria bacterium]